MSVFPITGTDSRGVVHTLWRIEGDNQTLFHSREGAEDWAKPRVCACGKPVEWKHYAICSACWDAAHLARVQALLDAAVEDPTHDGPVYLGYLGSNDGYFEDMDALLDYLADREGDRPEWAFCCKVTPAVSLSIEDIADMISDRVHSEDFGRKDIAGLDALQEAVARFNEANKDGYQNWDLDHKRKVRIPHEDPGISPTNPGIREDEEASS